MFRLTVGALHARPTDDIDTFHPLTPVVQKAVEAAQRSTGLTIPVSFAAAADAPYDFEDRLIPIRALRLKRLTVLVPERHAIMPGRYSLF